MMQQGERGGGVRVLSFAGGACNPSVHFRAASTGIQVLNDTGLGKLKVLEVNDPAREFYRRSITFQSPERMSQNLSDYHKLRVKKAGCSIVCRSGLEREESAIGEYILPNKLSSKKHQYNLLCVTRSCERRPK